MNTAIPRNNNDGVYDSYAQAQADGISLREGHQIRIKSPQTSAAVVTEITSYPISGTNPQLYIKPDTGGTHVTNVQITTEGLISSTSFSGEAEGYAIKTVGYSNVFDEGGALWIKTSRTGTPSQSPGDLLDGELTDANGDVWENSDEIFSSASFGCSPSKSAAQNDNPLQAFFNYANSSKKIGLISAFEVKFSTTKNIQGEGVTLISSSLSTLRYMGDTVGIELNGLRHDISFGTVTVDITNNVTTRKCIQYKQLSRCRIKLNRLGENAGTALYWDGPNSTGNSGDNHWDLGNVETGGAQYAVDLDDSPSFALEGDTFESSSTYAPVNSVVRIGRDGGPKTNKFNQIKMALYGSANAAPVSQHLVELYSGFNTVEFGVWTESLNEEVICGSGTSDNYIIGKPGLQRGGRDDIRIADNGTNYYLGYKNRSDVQGDDSVRSFRPLRNYGILEVYVEQRGYCQISFNVSSPQIELISSPTIGGVTFGVYTTALNGTTGTDGQINIGVDQATGLIYIENRTGLSRRLVYETRLFG